MDQQDEAHKHEGTKAACRREPPAARANSGSWTRQGRDPERQASEMDRRRSEHKRVELRELVERVETKGDEGEEAEERRRRGGEERRGRRYCRVGEEGD